MFCVTVPTFREVRQIADSSRFSQHQFAGCASNPLTPVMTNIKPIPVTTESAVASVSPALQLIASPWHTLLVLAADSIHSYFGAARAAQARAGLGPSRPYMYLRMMLFEFLFLAIVVVGVRLRTGSLQSIFGPRWRSLGQILRDLALA